MSEEMPFGKCFSFLLPLALPLRASFKKQSLRTRMQKKVTSAVAVFPESTGPKDLHVLCDCRKAKNFYESILLKLGDFENARECISRPDQGTIAKSFSQVSAVV